MPDQPKKLAIIVAGMHRSGTSALTRVLSLVGCDLPKNLLPPVPGNNDSGFWESEPIKVLNDDILASAGSTWKDWRAFDSNWYTSPVTEGFRERAQSLLLSEFGDSRLFVLKDPRICRLLSFWTDEVRKFGADFRIVLPFRNPLDVAKSLKTRDEIDTYIGHLMWLRNVLEAEFFSRDHRRAIVRYDALLSTPHTIVDMLSEALGVTWPRGLSADAQIMIDEFISADLRHQQHGDIELLSNPRMSYWIKSSFDILSQWSYGGERLADRETLDDIKSTFDAAVPAFSPIFTAYENTTNKLGLNAENLNRQLTDLGKALARRDEQIESLNKDIAERDHRLNNLDQDIKESNQRIEDLNKSITERNQQARDLNLIVKKRDRRLENANQIIFEKERQLHALQNSRSWIITAPLRAPRRVLEYMKSKAEAWQTRRSSAAQPKSVGFGPDNKQLSMGELPSKFRAAGFFDDKYYLDKNPDVSAAGVDPLEHFCNYGWREGRNPSENFDVKFYLDSYPSALASGINPVAYHLHTGSKKGFKTVPESRVATTSGVDSPSSPCALVPDLSHMWPPDHPYLQALQSQASNPTYELPRSIIAMATEEVSNRPITVSVIIPVWNRESCVCRAIESALAQSYKPSEIIVVDDGSTDSSIRIIRDRFASELRTGSIQLIETSHTGVSDARNCGLMKATGDLIAYLDSDNVWRTDYLLIMAGLFSAVSEISTAYAALSHNDGNNNELSIRATPYDRNQLLHRNYIDLNIFMHRRHVYLQNGGFDTNLKRLVDWDFILSCTRLYSPIFVPYVGVEYHLDHESLGNITTTIPLESSLDYVQKKHMVERIHHGLAPLRIAYVLWDWPALSQTFVIKEIRWLVKTGQDIIVYYKVDPDRVADLDFDITAYRVRDETHLAELLILHNRTLCHTHFAYPAAALLTYPASLATGIPFTLFAHAVDIFHHANRSRNRIAEIVKDRRCLKVFVHGDYHRCFLETQGVPVNKMVFSLQAADLSTFESTPPLPKPSSTGIQKGIFIGRFIEKKGVGVLIEAANMLRDAPVVFDLYGYGPLEQDYREKIAELGLENIHLKGVLDGDDAVLEAMRDADFLVAPSVVAANGDAEGFPTVILESMAAARPVIASAVSAVPNYLRNMTEAVLVTPGDPTSLTAGVRRLLAMSPERREAMLAEAKRFLRKSAGVGSTVRKYMDIWRGDLVDIFMVTYNTTQYDDRTETFEIIRRTLQYTTMPFNLTVVDNNSDADFRSELIEFCKNEPLIRLILLEKNIFCGPASNKAMALGNGRLAIYLCSKEAFARGHGWERPLVEYMSDHAEYAMAGYRTHMPKFTLGKEIEKHPEFHKFRNPQFASANPDRPFTHIQGGIYIIRRSILERHGGFSDSLPQQFTDVEFSYFLESVGMQLGVVDEVASISIKTKPELSSVLDEHIAVAHPLTIAAAEELYDARRHDDRAWCNICCNEMVNVSDFESSCAACDSTPFGRSVYRRLAHDWRTHRGSRAVLLSSDLALSKALGDCKFDIEYQGTDPQVALGTMVHNGGAVDIVIVDMDELPNPNPHSFVDPKITTMIANMLAPGGLLLSASRHQASNRLLASRHKGLLTSIAPRERALSRVFREDWRRFSEYTLDRR